MGNGMGALGKCEDVRLLVKVIDKAKEDGKLPKKIKASIKEITGRDVFVLRKEGKISEVFFDSNKNGELDIDTDLKYSTLKEAVDTFDKALLKGVPDKFASNKLREKYDFAIFKTGPEVPADRAIGIMFDLKADGAIDSFNSISLRRNDSWGSIADFTDRSAALKEAKLSPSVNTLIAEYCDLKSLKDLPKSSGLEKVNARHNKIEDKVIEIPSYVRSIDLRNCIISGKIALKVLAGTDLVDLRGNKITGIDFSKSKFPTLKDSYGAEPTMIVVDYAHLVNPSVLKTVMTDYNVQFVAYGEAEVIETRRKWIIAGKTGSAPIVSDDDGPLPERIKKK